MRAYNAAYSFNPYGYPFYVIIGEVVLERILGYLSNVDILRLSSTAKEARARLSSRIPALKNYTADTFTLLFGCSSDATTARQFVARAELSKCCRRLVVKLPSSYLGNTHLQNTKALEALRDDHARKAALDNLLTFCHSLGVLDRVDLTILMTELPRSWRSKYAIRTKRPELRYLKAADLDELHTIADDVFQMLNQLRDIHLGCSEALLATNTTHLETSILSASAFSVVKFERKYPYDREPRLQTCFIPRLAAASSLKELHLTFDCPQTLSLSSLHFPNLIKCSLRRIHLPSDDDLFFVSSLILEVLDIEQVSLIGGSWQTMFDRLCGHASLLSVRINTVRTPRAHAADRNEALNLCMIGESAKWPRSDLDETGHSVKRWLSMIQRIDARVFCHCQIAAGVKLVPDVQARRVADSVRSRAWYNGQLWHADKHE